MKNILRVLNTIFVLILMTITSYSQLKVNKESMINKLVLGFIKDYKEWNDFSYKINKTDKQNGTEKAKEAYEKLILKYCRPNLKHQNIAFGSKSMHDPRFEIIVSTSIVSDTAFVTTNYKYEDSTYIDIFEYIFIKNGDKWLLENLYYVDDEGKYKGL